MNNGKYYAVKKGIKTGIFNNWEECKENVMGFQGAEYKSFKSLEEAKNYLSRQDNEKETTINYDNYDAVAYTDGSYDVESGHASYGAVLLMNNSTYEFSGLIEDNYESRNVTGEIEAVKQLIDFAVQRKANCLLICHDYEGISKWVDGSWKARSQISIEYLEYIQKIKTKIKIDYKKVIAHSGDKYNEIADALAKNELKSLRPDTKNEYGYQSYRYSDKHVNQIIEQMRENHKEFHAIKNTHTSHTVYTCTLANKEKMILQKYTFKNGNALNAIVDTKTNIFNLFFTYLTEKDRPDSILQSLNVNLNESIQIEKIKKKYNEIFNNQKIDITVYRLVLQSIYNFYLEIEDFIDSSFLTVPAFRALEAHLKRLIKSELEITIGNRFNLFIESEVKGIYIMKNDSLNISISMKNYILKCYNYFVNHRNPLFHSGNIDVGDIMMLNTSESKVIIMDTLRMIAEYHSTKRDNIGNSNID
jgi:ribonuclease HI